MKGRRFVFALQITAAIGAALCCASAQTPVTGQGVAPQNVFAANQHAQEVQALIGKAETAYKSGVDNYNAGRLDAARMDFDFAVDSMLSSSMDIKAEPALSDEFDRLLSAINSLELVALQQGNGFSPKIEDAPADVAGDVTFTASPELLAKVQQQLRTTQSDLPLVVNDTVAGWINYYQNSPAGHAHLKRSLERAGKYKAMIQKVLAEYGVPQDLIYLAVAESGFQAQVLNRSSGAGGMWQFMPFVNSYGLSRNGYFDERFDPYKSSVAYAKYMKSLYNQFGDWYLAMAAYDWGPGNVQRVVGRTGYADFWELYHRNVMPAETRNYVPAIIAAAICAKNPAQYGLTDLVPDKPVVSDTVTTTYAIDLRLVADVTDSSVAEIVSLNPALLRLSTPADNSYDLHLPPGTHDLYTARLKDIPESNRARWRFHVVKAGETLDSIAALLHAHATDIATYNDVTTSSPLQVDDELVVPVTASVALAGQQRYKVRRGDTLVAVADRFGVSTEQLREWNRLRSSALPTGRSIYVAEPIRLAPGGGRRSRVSARSRRGASHGSHPAHGGKTTGSKAAHGGGTHAAKSTGSTRKRRR